MYWNVYHFRILYNNCIGRRSRINRSGFHPSVRISVFIYCGEGRRNEVLPVPSSSSCCICLALPHALRMDELYENFITWCQVGKQNFRDVDPSTTRVVSFPLDHTIFQVVYNIVTKFMPYFIIFNSTLRNFIVS